MFMVLGLELTEAVHGALDLVDEAAAGGRAQGW
jgi:hypothetical protein